MSRIGRKPIIIPAGVQITVNGNNVQVSGPKGKLEREIYSKLSVAINGNELHVINNSTISKDKAQYGLFRQLISNMVEGVSKGFEKKIVINGVGYKIVPSAKGVTMSLGFSHPVEVVAEEGIQLESDKTTLTIRGIDKEKVGQFAAKVRAIKPVEPYHAYGIRYEKEFVLRKEVKSGKASKK